MSRLCIIQYNKYNLQERDKYPRIFFYKQLKRKLEEKGYKVILFKSDYPKEINDILDKHKIDLIINFEDYYIRYSRHFHSNCPSSYSIHKNREYKIDKNYYILDTQNIYSMPMSTDIEPFTLISPKKNFPPQKKVWYNQQK